MGKYLSLQIGLQATGKGRGVTFLEPLLSVRHCAKSFSLSHVLMIYLILT